MRSIHVIFDKYSNRCSGYALVAYHTSEHVTMVLSEDRLIDMLGEDWEENTQKLVLIGDEIKITDLPIDEDGIDPRDGIEEDLRDGIEEDLDELVPIED